MQKTILTQIRELDDLVATAEHNLRAIRVKLDDIAAAMGFARAPETLAERPYPDVSGGGVPFASEPHFTDPPRPRDGETRTNNL